VNTKRLIVLAAIETVAIALCVCLLLFAFRYTPPTSTPIPAPSKTWSPEQAGWPYPSPIAWERYRPYLQEEIDTAGMAKNCVKLERLFQEVADLPDADELMTYVDRWVCIPNASTKRSDRHLN
jgi:hypothetical protein